MDGLEFRVAAPPVTSDPARADVACFIGFVGCRDSEPESQRRRLELLDVPLPIDSWDGFDALLAWDQRALEASPAPLSGALATERRRVCDTALGTAVRAFFAQGGRKCYVVRVGDPWPVLAPAQDRATALAFLPSVPPVSPSDRGTWRGLGHLFGLPDVSFLCLPDLPELFAVESRPHGHEFPPPGEERFVECATLVDPPGHRHLRGFPAPRCDADGFGHWANLVRRIGELLSRHAREVQFVAAVPLPVNEAALAGDPSLASNDSKLRQSQMAQKVRAARDAQWRHVAGIQTAFVQLAYPWLRTRNAANLPEELESPEGSLAGLLADNALARGAWHSLLNRTLPNVLSVEPVLSRADLGRELPFDDQSLTPRNLRERVSLVGPTSGGFRILSDVTTDDDEAYRPANVNRLLVAILRAARLVGEALVFENNGEGLWRRLRDSMISVLARLWADGALRGATAAEAFEVRCDRSTMTQTDIDAGRVVVRLAFTAAAPIQRIVVVLAISERGPVSLVSAQAPTAKQEAA